MGKSMAELFYQIQAMVGIYDDQHLKEIVQNYHYITKEEFEEWIKSFEKYQEIVHKDYQDKCNSMSAVLKDMYNYVESQEGYND